MSTKKGIYDLKLHESTMFSKEYYKDKYVSMFVTRVPGGFIYQTYERNSIVFVPYNEEFK